MTPISLNNMSIEIAINEKICGKPHIPEDHAGYRRLFREINSNFRNKKLDINELIQHIQSGHAYTSQLYNGYRHGRNFKQVQHIAFDLDHLSMPIEDIDDELILNHAAFLHTTASDKPDSPKSRAVFILESPITSGEMYTVFVKSLYMLSSLEIDEVCHDYVRLFFGAKNCRIKHLGNLLTKKQLFSMSLPFFAKIKAEQEQAKQAKPIDISSLNGVSNLTVRTKIEKILQPIFTCPNGEKHTTLLKTSKLVGGYVPHYVSFEQAQQALEQAIKTRDIRSFGAAQDTIKRGLVYGSKQPIKINASEYMSISDFDFLREI